MKPSVLSVSQARSPASEAPTTTTCSRLRAAYHRRQRAIRFRGVSTTPAGSPPPTSTPWSSASFPGSGNECVELGAGFAVARYIALAGDVRPGGFISGPTQFSLADAALWYAVFTAIGRVEPMALT